MLLQDDLGVEDGGQNGGTIGAKPSTGAFRDAPGARLPGDAVWGCIWAVFWGPSARARGSKIDPILVQNRSQKPPRRRPDGFQSRLQKGNDFSANFDSVFIVFQTQGVG